MLESTCHVFINLCHYKMLLSVMHSFKLCRVMVWCRDFRQGKASVRLTDDFRRLGGLMLRNMSVLQVKLQFAIIVAVLLR